MNRKRAYITRVAPVAPVVPVESGDPFGEHSAARFHRRRQLLGGDFHFHADSSELVQLIEAGYSGLPVHRLAGRSPRFDVRLRLTAGVDALAAQEPPPARMSSGAGFLYGAMDSANFVVLDPVRRAGLVAISRAMLRFPYHARYELLEFAVFTLAARAQSLVPLHAACVALDGVGVLLDGASGAGKSTVVLQCLLQGLECLAEDATFILPRGMRATGVANFLHLRRDSLRFLDDAAARSRIEGSPVIRRRSGTEKFEVDLRGAGWRVAATPPRVVAVVFVSSEQGVPGRLLRPLSARECLRRLASTQAYARRQESWPAFTRGLARLRAFELRRAGHPSAAVDALRGLLNSHP